VDFPTFDAMLTPHNSIHKLHSAATQGTLDDVGPLLDYLHFFSMKALIKACFDSKFLFISTRVRFYDEHLNVTFIN
jgi:hypothetical protein